jgi:hypothetical protein
VVSRLSDVGFPVERVNIVGTELHSGKQAKRFTVGRAARVSPDGSGWWPDWSSRSCCPHRVADPPAGRSADRSRQRCDRGTVAYWATDWCHASAGSTEGLARRYAVDVDRTHAVEAVLALDRS